MRRRTPAGGAAVAVAAVASTVTTVFPVYLVSVLVVQIGADMPFGPADLGVLVAGFFGCSAVAAFLSGQMASSTASTRLVRASATLSSACLLAVGLLAQGPRDITVALLVAGLSNGIGQPASNGLIAAVVPSGRQGVAYGAKQAAIPLSMLFAGLAVPLLALPFGWRAVFLVAAGLGLLTAACTPARGRTSQRGTLVDSPAAGPLRLPALLVLSSGLLLAAGTGNALGTFFVASAVEAGVQAGTAGLLAAVAGGTGAVTRILLGMLADRYQARWLLVIAVLIAFGGVGHALLATGDPSLLPVAVVIAYGSGWTWAGVATYAVVRMHPSAASRATGVTQSGMALGAALGPLAFGVAVRHWSYDAAWATTAACSVLAGSFILIGRSMLLRDRPALATTPRGRRVSQTG